MASFLSKKGVDHQIEINGEKRTLCFYPIRPARLMFLRDVAGALLKALSTLFGAANRDDQRKEQQSFGTDGYVTKIKPPPTKLIELRKRHTDQAIEQLTTTLLHEENLKVLAMLIMDSLRDEYPNGPDRPEDFLEQTDMAILPQLLEGLAKGNAKVLGPLTGVLGNLKGRLLRFPAPPRETSSEPLSEPMPDDESPSDLGET